MKRLTALFLTLILLLALAACGGNPVGGGDESGSLDSDRSFSRYLTMACATEDTVYFIVRDHTNEDFAGEMLYYMDKATGITGPLCGKPECRHHDESCNAFLTNGTVRSLTSYNGRLYWITTTFKGKEPIGLLYSEAYDGTDRRLVRELGDDIFDLPVTTVQIHRGYIYLTGHPNGIVDGETQFRNHIVAYPLDPDEKGFVILDEEVSVFRSYTQIYGDCMYILSIDPGGNIDRFTLRKWNIKTRELETIFDGETSFGLNNAFWVTDTGIYLSGTISGSHTIDADGNEMWERYVYFYLFSSGEFEPLFPYSGKLGVSGKFSENLFITKIHRSDRMGNLPQDLSGQELLNIIVRDFEGQIILDTTYNIGDWPVDVIAMTFAGADESNLYFQAPLSSTYFVAIPLDGGEPVIVWNGNT